MPVTCTPTWIDDGTYIYPEGGLRTISGVSGSILGNSAVSGSLVIYDQSGGSVRFSTVSSVGTSYGMYIPAVGSMQNVGMQVGSASVGYLPMWTGQSVLSASPFSYGVVEPLCSYIGTPGNAGKVAMYNGVLDSNADDLFQGAGMSLVGDSNASAGSCGPGGAEIWITDNSFLILVMDVQHQNEQVWANFSKAYQTITIGPVQSAAALYLDIANSASYLGDYNTTNNGTIFQVDDANKKFNFLIGVPGIGTEAFFTIDVTGTIGTVTSGAWAGNTITTPYGGTGYTTYTPGQILVGNSSNTLTATTLSAGPGITINNGSGYIAISASVLNTVTSVGLSLPAQFTVSGSPVTGSGTLTAVWANQIANVVFAGPSSGGSTVPAFRALVSSDIPSLAYVTQVVGTTNQITITNGTTTPTASIASTYVGQSSITTLGKITTGVWSGSVISMAEGGTSANLTPANGSIFYSTATATALLAANSTGTNKYLQSVSSGVPSWVQIASTDIINTSFVTQVVGTANQIVIGGTFVPTASIAPTYSGQTSITTLGTVTTGVWSGSVISLAKGGTSAALTPSNGGIHYSTATATAILAGTATAQQILMSGASSAPIWSLTTYPTGSVANQIMYASATNVLSGLATANNGVLITSNTGVPSIGSVGPSLSVVTGSLNTVQQIRTTDTPQFAGLGLGIPANANALLVASSSVAPTFQSNGQYASARNSIASSKTPTFNWNNGNVQYMVMPSTSSVTSITFQNPMDGGRYVLILRQGSLGSGSIASSVWNSSSVLWSGGTGSAPVMTATPNKTDIFSFLYDGTNAVYYGNYSNNY